MMAIAGQMLDALGYPASLRPKSRLDSAVPPQVPQDLLAVLREALNPL